MNSLHSFHLGTTNPQKSTEGGSRIDVDATLFPALHEMSISLLTLQARGVREPHWHPNAHELGYCFEGKGIMTIVSPSGNKETFTIEAGSVVFVPMGYLHDIENCGEKPLKCLLCFSDKKIEEINLSSACGGFPTHAIGALFKEGPSFFDHLHFPKHASFISKNTRPIKNFENIPFQSRFKLDTNTLTPQIHTEGGWAKEVIQQTLPLLESLGLFVLRLNPFAIREPHWHPNAHELNYLIRGKVRINLFSPDEKVESFELFPGDISFLPRGYMHYIENIGDEDVDMAVFFSHPSPSDIGLTNAFVTYSPGVLGSIFHADPADFERFSQYPSYRPIVNAIPVSSHVK